MPRERPGCVLPLNNHEVLATEREPVAEHSTKLEGIRVIEMSSTVATSLDKYEQEKKTNEN